MNPLAELRRFLANSETIARAKKNWSELMGYEAASDIAADIVKHEGAIRDEAHRAAVSANEALKLIQAAQAPDSDGGANITPAEAKVFVPYMVNAEAHAHDASEMATV